jgi:hypothetical protein
MVVTAAVFQADTSPLNEEAPSNISCADGVDKWR